MRMCTEFIKNIISNNVIKRSQNIIERFFKEREGEGEIIQQSPKWAIATTWGLQWNGNICNWMAGFAEQMSCDSHRNTRTTGSVRAIQLPMGGIASDILVKDGEEVKAGQVLMQLDAETTKQRLNSLKESQRLKITQLNLKKTELNQYLSLNDEEINMIKRNLSLQKEVLTRYKSLFELGATSELQYIERLNQVAELEGRLRQTRVDRLRQKAAQDQQIQLLKSDLEELQTLVTEASVNLRYQVLRAPVDGIVFDLQPRGKGYALEVRK